MDGAATRSTERAARGAATRPAAAWNIMDCAANSMCFAISGIGPGRGVLERWRVVRHLSGTGDGNSGQERRLTPLAHAHADLRAPHPPILSGARAPRSV